MITLPPSGPWCSQDMAALHFEQTVSMVDPQFSLRRTFALPEEPLVCTRGPPANLESVHGFLKR
jgi:hypothetical protein